MYNTIPEITSKHVAIRPGYRPAITQTEQAKPEESNNKTQETSVAILRM
ncbi:MAG: hypothetical protein ACM3PT_11050 [Deltaproteobacteria bacterium]